VEYLQVQIHLENGRWQNGFFQHFKKVYLQRTIELNLIDSYWLLLLNYVSLGRVGQEAHLKPFCRITEKFFYIWNGVSSYNEAIDYYCDNICLAATYYKKQWTTMLWKKLADVSIFAPPLGQKAHSPDSMLSLSTVDQLLACYLINIISMTKWHLYFSTIYQIGLKLWKWWYETYDVSYNQLQI